MIFHIFYLFFLCLLWWSFCTFNKLANFFSACDFSLCFCFLTAPALLATHGKSRHQLRPTRMLPYSVTSGLPGTFGFLSSLLLNGKLNNFIKISYLSHII